MPKNITLSRDERRARREARREKQRAESVVRAQKMHALRTAQERDDSSHLTADSYPLPKINVGCSGWFYWHWSGVFYPRALPRNEWFKYYASRFKSVELNAPFYSWPTIGTVKTWQRQAGRRKFIYTVKVCELITHTKRFSGTKTLVRDFGFIADILDPRMGCFLFQFPPSFNYTAARLKAIVSQLDRNRRNVVEFRHPSWWNDRVYGAFRDSGTIFCSCSAPRLPDQMIKTADEVYIRFHGTKRWYRHDYSKTELAGWTKRITDSGAQRVWAYFNNDREGYSIKNARELLRQLRRG